jgi:hypothetical protein
MVLWALRAWADESFHNDARIRVRARPYPLSIADTSGFTGQADTPIPGLGDVMALFGMVLERQG